MQLYGKTEEQHNFVKGLKQKIEKRLLKKKLDY